MSFYLIHITIEIFNLFLFLFYLFFVLFEVKDCFESSTLNSFKLQEGEDFESWAIDTWRDAFDWDFDGFEWIYTFMDLDRV